VFDADTETYTLATAVASEEITAESDFDIVVKVDDVVVVNGAAFAWEEGANVVEVEVTNNLDETVAYEVTVTYTAG